VNDQLLRGLRVRGAQVHRVPIYRWELPDDLAPLHAAIAALCEGQAQIAIFTSANQVYTLFHVAADAERLRQACAGVLIASIGPVCSEALREHGLVPDLEPDHPKMGRLVGEVARLGPGLLARKRQSMQATTPRVAPELERQLPEHRKRRRTSP
jgi:uroporphyrinogen-III synthase